jgi:hypothetical protein
VPPKPNENWYLQEQVDEFNKARQDPDTYLVVMTGRKEPFRFAVERLLKNLDLSPDELILKDPNQGSTEKYKTKAMHGLLDRMPSIQSVEFYEDRHDHLDAFQKSIEERGLEFIPHPVEFENPRQTWDDFLDTFYEGGKKKVKNPNMDTRDQYPEVTVAYLLQNDEKYRWELQREFREWFTQGRPDQDSHQRVASAWLRQALQKEGRLKKRAIPNLELDRVLRLVSPSHLPFDKIFKGKKRLVVDAPSVKPTPKSEEPLHALLEKAGLSPDSYQADFDKGTVTTEQQTQKGTKKREQKIPKLLARGVEKMRRDWIKRAKEAGVPEDVARDVIKRHTESAIKDRKSKRVLDKLGEPT